MKEQFKERLQVLDMLEKMAGEGTRNIAFSRNHARLLIDEGLKLVEENARLEAWKREAIAVESTWDVQAVGKLIGTPLGGDIRAGVQPYIEGLQSENERMMEVLSRYEKWEADLILSNEAWEGILPVFTQELYDSWMEIQTARNEALSQGGQS